MLFFPKNILGVSKVLYDEPSSTIFITYLNKKEQDFYKVDRTFFNKVIFPIIDKDDDFRSLLFWGERNNYAKKIINSYLEVNLDKYNA